MDVNVSELLLQLEELKQRKARNVKKLKKKLGRATVLNSPVLKQPVFNEEHSVHSLNTVEQNLSSNFESFGGRNVLSDISTENNDNIQCIENNRHFEFAKICSDSNTKASSGLSLHSASQAIHLEAGSISKKISFPENSAKVLPVKENASVSRNEMQTSGSLNLSNIISSETNETPNKRISTKRSVNELQDEEISTSSFEVKKKTKVSSTVASDSSDNHGLDVEKVCKRTIPNTSKDSIKFLENVKSSSLENDSECIFPSQFSKEKSNLTSSEQAVKELQNSNLQEQQISSYSAEESQVVFDDCKMQEIINDLNDGHHKDEEGVVNSKNLIKALNNKDVKENNCIPQHVEDANILENSTDDKFEVKKGKTVLVPSENISSQHFHKPVFKDNIDENVLEVADTEIECLAPKEHNPVDFKTEEKFNNSVFEPKNSNNEDFVNIESDVANFEEVVSEKEPENHSPAHDSSPLSPKERDPLECDFSDEEYEHDKYIDSDEIRAIFKSDSEENIDSQENNSQFEVPETTDILGVKPGMQLEKNVNVEMLCDKKGLDLSTSESGVLIVPETELFDFASYNESEVDAIAHNISVTTVSNIENAEGSFNKAPDIVQEIDYSKLPYIDNCYEIGYSEQESKNDEIASSKLISEKDFDTDSLNTEDFFKLLDSQQEPLTSVERKSNSSKTVNFSDKLSSSLKFQCCLQSEIHEEVNNLKLTSFNNSLYLFIQHLTWIQVWREEKDSEWIKIFAHQVEDLQIHELCLSQNENYLVLIMLLKSNDLTHCLQFIIFERESRLIKLMEHTHWFENRDEEKETIFLCGLDDLKFAAAQGLHTFQVSTHAFSCLDSNPRLHTVTLGSTMDCLHSLCRIEKLPNALLGMNNNMLYVWHLLEARLVTSVHLQPEGSLNIEKCIWAVVENGLVFLMAACGDSNDTEVCQLLAVNLATGFCEIALNYTFQPANESFPTKGKMTLVYSEPLIGATCNKGAFIWSAEEEYCCAVLKGKNYTNIAIAQTFDGDAFMVIVGCAEGCVNCYIMGF